MDWWLTIVTVLTLVAMCAVVWKARKQGMLKLSVLTIISLISVGALVSTKSG